MIQVNLLAFLGYLIAVQDENNQSASTGTRSRVFGSQSVGWVEGGRGDASGGGGSGS